MEWLEQLPPITKGLLVGTVFFTFAGHFGIFSPISLVLYKDFIFHNFEIWRFATCLLYQGKLGFGFLINTLCLYRHSLSLETQAVAFAGRTSDYLFMIMFGSALLILGGLFYPFPLLGQGLLLMLTYYWSRKFPNQNMNFFSIPFKGRYLPWVLVGMNFVMGGDPTLQLFGILVGHIYFFFADVVPIQWGRQYLRTPWFLYRLFPPEYNANSPGYAQARRVGHEARVAAGGNIWAGNGHRF